MTTRPARSAGRERGPAPAWAGMAARARRFLAVYLALLGLLAGVRYATRDTLGELRTLQDREGALRQRRAQLKLEVSTRESAAQVRAWAETVGMVPWTKARHEFAALEGLKEPPPPPSASPKLEVSTEWR